MKKVFLKMLCLILCLTAVASVTVVSAEESTAIMPRLTGIDAQAVDLSISANGRADCWCLIFVDTGYSVDVTMTLEQDGTAIKTWTGSGSSGSRVELDKSYYVIKDHDYQVVVTTRVKTAGGSYLLSYTLESNIEHY